MEGMGKGYKARDSGGHRMLRSNKSVEDDDHEKVCGAKLSIRCHIVFL